MIIKNTLAKVHGQKIHRYFGYTGKSVTMEGFPAAKLQRHFWFEGKWYNGKRYNGKITAAFSTQSARRVTGLSFGTGFTSYKLLFFGEKMLRLLRKKSEKKLKPIFL